MCLACELDALWYAEWERLAAEGAGAPGAAERQTAGAGTPGLPPALPGEPGIPESAVETFASPSPSSGGDGDEPSAQAFAEARRAGGMPAAPGSPARPAPPRSGFLCEETE